MVNRAVILLVGSALLGTSPVAYGGANFSEHFDNNGPVQSGADGPQNLINQGWIFRNQSSPVGSGTWFTGYNSWFPPQAGAGLRREPYRRTEPPGFFQ